MGLTGPNADGATCKTAMLKDFILYIKYPYTAGVIATIWIGSAVLIGMDRDLPVLNIVIVNCVTIYLIALIGFRGGRD